VSNTSTTLQDIASVDDFLNAAATETVPLFEHLEFEFLLEYEFISQQTSSAASCTATIRTSTLHDQLHENSSTASSGTTVDSKNHLPETRLTGFLPTSNTSSTMFSRDSSSRLPFGACSTQHTPSIQPTSKRSSTTTLPRVTTIQQPKRTTTASAVRSSQPAQRFRSQRSSTGQTSRPRDGDARHVTRSPSIHRSGCLETAPTTSSI